ncbi:Gfo/Idh/MocA family protein [Streptomyces incanus]|uniref:Aldo/keto reductase n=1 Tax=Streptomyces incanus TaxID=887453 RepID=A0ABW0XQ21_9ACTN
MDPGRDNRVQFTSLGGIEVSCIGLGAMGMSAIYTGAGRDDAESVRTIQRAVDLGVTHLDTAEVYGPYVNEARIAAEAFGAERWFADPFELIRAPSVDLITVAVKGPAHRELVLAALAADKAVYSESPLGATVAQTEEMAYAVGSLHTAIGLQGRLNPPVRRAAESIAQGRLGRLFSASVAATTFGNGPESVSAYEYFDKAAGAGFLTIAAGHVLSWRAYPRPTLTSAWRFAGRTAGWLKLTAVTPRALRSATSCCRRAWTSPRPIAPSPRVPARPPP